MIRATIAFCLICVPALADTAASAKSPHLVERPEGATPAPPETAMVSETKMRRDAADQSPAKLPVPTLGMRDRVALGDDDHAACLSTLSDMGVIFSEADPIIPSDDADCGILRPIDVREIAPGVAIAPQATLRCPTALAVAMWTRDFVLPATERLTERGALTTILNGSGYVCRRRNNLPTGKLSQHAFGNAFDVMGFRFAEGPPIPIMPREAQGSMAEAFQDAVRASACLGFSTVLGPGSNAAHADHLHLDIVARSSGYRLCEQGGQATD